MTAEPESHRLSPQQAAEIFHEVIVPRRLAHGVRQDQPVLVVVAGQPGAGKSAAERRVHAALGEGAVTIDADDMRGHHPDYVALTAANDRTAAMLTHHEAQRWVAMAKEHCIEQRNHVVLSATLGNPESARRHIDQFRAAGYRVELAVVAVDDATSQLGVLDRYQAGRERDGVGRFVPLQVQQEAYTGLLETVAAVDAERLVDAVHVYQRDGRQLYGNALDESGRWESSPATRQAVETARDRPWEASAFTAFRESAESLARRLPEDLRPELRAAVGTALSRLARAPGPQGPQWHRELRDSAVLAALEDPDLAAARAAAWVAGASFPQGARAAVRGGGRPRPVARPPGSKARGHGPGREPEAGR